MFVRSLIHLMWLKAVTCARSVQVILIGDLVKQVRTPPVRPADGADTPGGVFRPGENMALGRRGRLSLRMAPESIADLRGPLELNSAMQFTDREWAPQTLIFARSPIPRQSSPGTKDSYTHPTIPSAGRTGSVLTRLFKQSFFLRLLPIWSHTVHRIIKTP